MSTASGYFYITSGKRYRVLTQRVLDSYSPLRVVKTTDAALSKYPIKGKLRFRSGSLIYNISDGKMFLIEDGKRRLVTSPDALERIGAKLDDAVVVSVAELNLHGMGEDFN